MLWEKSVFYVRLDTAVHRASPRHSPARPAGATTVDRASPSHRPGSAGASASPARCPVSSKSSPASGKASAVASPLTDSRRRRSTDYRNSQRHANDSSVGGLNGSLGGLLCDGGIRGQSSASRHSVRCSGIQSASSLSVTVTDGRPEPVTTDEHAAIHPATHSATHSAVLAGCSESHSQRRTVGMQSIADNRHSNSRLPVTDSNSTATSTTTTTTTTMDADGAGADSDAKLRCELCIDQPRSSRDTNGTSEVLTAHLVCWLY